MENMNYFFIKITKIITYFGFSVEWFIFIKKSYIFPML